MDTSEFKSYYVVWKRGFSKTMVLCPASLNRTMQYGNVSSDETVQKVEIGLNRTMQYGNWELVGQGGE